MCVQMQSARLRGALHLKQRACQCRRLPVGADLRGTEGQPTAPTLQHAVRDSLRSPSQSDGRRERLLFH